MPSTTPSDTSTPSGATRSSSAGDIVDYGCFPDETIALLASRKIPTIRGNHDRWALHSNNESGASASRGLLSPASKAWLRELPTKWETSVDGVRIAVHHGRPPKSDMDPVFPADLRLEDGRRLLDAAEADVLVVGHTHIAFALEVVGRGWIVNPGATLRDPAVRGESPPATALFGVLTLPSVVLSVRSVTTAAEVTALRRSVVW